MLFPTGEFLFVYLPITIGVFFLIARVAGAQVAAFWLVLASLFFYGFWRPVHVLLLVASMPDYLALARLVKSFVSLLPGQFALDPGHIVLVFDADRKSLYGPGPRRHGCDTRDGVAQKLLRQEARALGIHVLETEPLFESYYARTHQRVDHSPVDWHWNGEAHRLVAREVAGIINGAMRPD